MTRIEAVKSHLLRQINSDESRGELTNLDGRDWLEEVNRSACLFAPLLVDAAPRLVKRLETVFQGPELMLRLLDSKKFESVMSALAITNPKNHQMLADFRSKASGFAKGTLELVTTYLVAQQITKVMEAFLTASMGDAIKRNGGSLYPDIYPVAGEVIYSELPVQRKKKKGQDLVETLHGPCRNSKGQPSKVPNGLELKSKRGTSIRVDCHAAHPGMHLVLTWSTRNHLLVVNDVSLAYIRICDYTECKRNTDATTVKFSFGGHHFVSLLND